MSFWCAARFEPRRENVGKHFLGLAGYQVYIPLLRELRIRRGKKFEALEPLFPGYGFISITNGQWRGARWSIGVASIVMDHESPAKVPDHVIDDIRAEVAGAIELPQATGPRVDDPVRVIGGLFQGHLALYAGMKPHQRVEILLSFLGSRQRVNVPARDIAFRDSIIKRGPVTRATPRVQHGFTSRKHH
jgi:transcriptional antiterminator RfaH